jgi:hypothetical protein
MAPSNPQPSETSPLLPKPSDTTQFATDPSGGIAPGGPENSGDDDQDGGDVERQTSNGDNSKHQGLPEVRKRMKYIFPAIAIGASITSITLRGIC